MLSWMQTKLNRRFLVATAAGMLISLIIFVLLFLGMYQNTVEQERKQAINQVNQLLRTSLENAMLKRDLDGLRQIIAGLGQQQDIVTVMITNPAGEVRFSSSHKLLGSSLSFDKTSYEATAGFVRDHAGREVLRSVNPVRNKAPCTTCHGPIERTPVNGILYIDYDAASLRSQARKSTLMLMGTGALIVLINIAGGWWFIRRYVLKPVASLSRASDSLRRGDLDTRVDLAGQDELALLGGTFNKMADTVQEQIIELEGKEAFLQSLIDGIPDGVRIIDSDFNILLANKSYKEQLGLPEDFKPTMCYASAFARNSPCPPTLITCPIHEMRQQRQPMKMLHHHVRADGTSMHVEVYAAPLTAKIEGVQRQLIVESIRDLEQAVRYSQEQKLAELGRLATGVAHEIYNPLASVRFALHESQQALDELNEPTDEVSNYLLLLEKEVNKCVDVTERLLKLGGPSGGSCQLLDLSTILSETISLLNWEAESKKVHVEQHCQEGIRVHVIDTEMRMVTLNLVQNAFHAMPDGGTLDVSCDRTEAGVLIRFRDTGIGIAPNDIRYIFDPFFSRRADGSRGTGLGLPISRTIVESHGGQISVESTPGEGSLFTVCLPDPDNPRSDS